MKTAKQIKELIASHQKAIQNSETAIEKLYDMLIEKAKVKVGEEVEVNHGYSHLGKRMIVTDIGIDTNSGRMQMIATGKVMTSLGKVGSYSGQHFVPMPVR